MNKNPAINLGNCHHRKYIPRLLELTRSRRIDPAMILTRREPMSEIRIGMSGWRSGPWRGHSYPAGPVDRLHTIPAERQGAQSQ
jgi:hypothetical protein